eukprot:scaffold103299_cov63-Phaeocystis_antarctica.AAC.3
MICSVCGVWTREAPCGRETGCGAWAAGPVDFTVLASRGILKQGLTQDFCVLRVAGSRRVLTGYAGRMGGELQNTR